MLLPPLRKWFWEGASVPWRPPPAIVAQTWILMPLRGLDPVPWLLLLLDANATGR